MTDDTLTKYLADCETRSFRATSLIQTRNVLKLIQRDVDMLTASTADVLALMASWQVSPETRGFRLSTLSGFSRSFLSCYVTVPTTARGW